MMILIMIIGSLMIAALMIAIAKAMVSLD